MTVLLYCKVLFIVTVVVGTSDAGRYTSCSEGCCRHEVCMHGRICYPQISCGESPRNTRCPDGECVDGQCRPYPQCNGRCSWFDVCTMHHNLGYLTCQYDLNIGRTTLCY